MSRKVSHRSSITNQPQCGGPIKAGLASRSTGFMMSVKPNHHFAPGQSFVDKKIRITRVLKNIQIQL